MSDISCVCLIENFKWLFQWWWCETFAGKSIWFLCFRSVPLFGSFNFTLNSRFLSYIIHIPCKLVQLMVNDNVRFSLLPHNASPIKVIQSCLRSYFCFRFVLYLFQLFHFVSSIAIHLSQLSDSFLRMVASSFCAFVITLIICCLVIFWCPAKINNFMRLVGWLVVCLHN